MEAWFIELFSTTVDAVNVTVPVATSVKSMPEASLLVQWAKPEVLVQLAQLLVVVVGVWIAATSLRVSRRQMLRDVHTGQISNIHDAYVTDWKEKNFVRPVEVSVYVRPDGTRYACDLGKPGNPGDTKSYDAPYANRLDIRNLIRRHLQFNRIEAGDDYAKHKKTLLEFWSRSKIERTWEKAACYNLTSSLQDLGVLVRTGALPASYVFMNAGRHVIEEWVYGMELVYSDFRRPGLNVSLATMRADSETGAMRRHAEWLACACAIYWHNHYVDGIVNFFIAELERACKGKEQRLCAAKADDLYNLGDRIEFKLPLDISGIIKRERALFPLDNHLVHERIATSINADINDILYPDSKDWARTGVKASRRKRFQIFRRNKLPEILRKAREERSLLRRQLARGKLIVPFDQGHSRVSKLTTLAGKIAGRT